ncbi:MAG: hypothetical protein B6244_08385 [Candidatus Cloacimonetes bacterium 4572_55]|nr:MAG: hypothetical protein B6244_08385 [Candidatus Cloacimonetes bacterium 4572_55]
MKIVHIVPGSGGSFYCENCLRDGLLVRSLRDSGHDVTMIPMYLPLFVDEPKITGNTPIFYGAINVYLKQTIPIFRKAPQWVERFLDSPFLLKIAAKKSGSTRAYGMEKMTLSMLRGDEGNQANELEKLTTWLKKEIKPDVVHLSNALLLGLADRIKRETGATIACMLQDEDQWVDAMRDEYIQLVWDAMAEKGKVVDVFFPVSRYYADVMKSKMRIPDEKIYPVYPGIDLDGYQPASLDLDPPTIGYLSRISRSHGFDILVDAFIRLKQDPDFRNLRLRVTGGKTTDDDDFIESQRQKLEKNGFLSDVDFIPDFDRKNRLEFLKSLSLLSVPVRKGEAFGVFQIEAMASGVPVVQPKIGAFPEIVETTRGGVVYHPNNAETLSDAIRSLLSHPDHIREMGIHALESVRNRFSVEQSTKDMIHAYQLFSKKT